MLTSEQEKAAAHLYGPALVSAGPGSGKTRVLTERIARLCMEVPAADICVFTFKVDNNVVANKLANDFA